MGWNSLICTGAGSPGLRSRICSFHRPGLHLTRAISQESYPFCGATPAFGVTAQPMSFCLHLPVLPAPGAQPQGGPRRFAPRNETFARRLSCGLLDDPALHREAPAPASTAQFAPQSERTRGKTNFRNYLFLCYNQRDLVLS
jgi:hypothetical protein